MGAMVAEVERPRDQQSPKGQGLLLKEGPPISYFIAIYKLFWKAFGELPRKAIMLWNSFQWKPTIIHLTQSYMDQCMIDLKQHQCNYTQKLPVSCSCKNNVFGAKICKYALSERCEGIFCGLWKAANSCHPDGDPSVPKQIFSGAENAFDPYPLPPSLVFQYHTANFRWRLLLIMIVTFLWFSTSNDYCFQWLNKTF